MATNLSERVADIPRRHRCHGGREGAATRTTRRALGIHLTPHLPEGALGEGWVRVRVRVRVRVKVTSPRRGPGAWVRVRVKKEWVWDSEILPCLVSEGSIMR